MPIFYFHLFNDVVVIDDEGVELADVAAAREQAMESARELVCESVHKGWLNLDHRIEVEDAAHNKLMTVSFRDAFTLTGEQPPGRP